jgi:hypothetical protein
LRFSPDRAGDQDMSLAASLRMLPARLPGERLTVGDILVALGDRGTAVILLIFSIPAILPTPGVPAGAIFGTALTLFALQMMAGAEGLRLPHRIARLNIRRHHLERLVSRAAPRLDRLERRVRPRWPALIGSGTPRPLGIVICLMAILIALPIPFGNTVPGLAIFLIALGMGQRDGAAVALGLGFALLACAVSVLLLAGGWWLVEVLLGTATVS